MSGEVTIPNGCVQIQIHWTPMSPLGSSPINSFGEQLSGDFDGDTFSAIGPVAIQSLISPLDSSWAVDFIRVRLGSSGGPPYAFVDFSGNGITGENSGGSQVPNVAALLKLSSLLPGRAGQGRMFLPGVPESEIDDNGVLTQTLRDDLVTGYGDMQTTLIANGFDGGLILHGEDSPSAGVVTAVLGVSCAAVAANQHRRLRN